MTENVPGLVNICFRRFKLFRFWTKRFSRPIVGRWGIDGLEIIANTSNANFTTRIDYGDIKRYVELYEQNKNKDLQFYLPEPFDYANTYGFGQKRGNFLLLNHFFGTVCLEFDNPSARECFVKELKKRF